MNLPAAELWGIEPQEIKAVKEGNYREVYQARKKLEKEGFSWSEKQEVAK